MKHRTSGVLAIATFTVFSLSAALNAYITRRGLLVCSRLS